MYIASLSFDGSSCGKHRVPMAVEILQFIQPWYGSEEFGSVMAVTRETSWLGEGTVAESLENFRRVRRENLQHMPDTWKAGATEWPVHRVESNKGCGFQELPHSESSGGRSPSESDSDDFDDGAFSDRNSVNNCSRQVHQSQHNHGLNYRIKVARSLAAYYGW